MSNSEVVDYSDVRSKLEAQREQLRGRVRAITSDVRKERGPLSADFSEQAVERENDEVLDALNNSSRRMLIQIESALERIDSHQYGNCVTCKKGIPVKRLVALPFAIHCIKCASKTGAS